MTYLVYIAISAGVLVGGSYLLLKIGQRPARHKVPASGDFTKFLRTILHRGYNGGFMMIETAKKEPFLQISKYIRSKGDVGLSLDFPQAPWSEVYFEKLKRELDKLAWLYEIEPTNPTQTEVPNLVSSFLTLDLEQDLQRANELVKLCLLKIFGLPEQELVTVFFINASLVDEKIGF
jgi:hypothetical protein